MQLGQVYLRFATFGWEIGRRPDRYSTDNPHLPSVLAGLLALNPKGEQTAAVLALGQLQLAFELMDNADFRLLVLDGLAKAAFLAERYDVARSHARALLEGTPRYSTGHRHVHQGNVILGRVALVWDDVALAKHHLLEAGKLSAGLGSSEPNMRLAADLLAHGETEVVLEYLELCSKF